MGNRCPVAHSPVSVTRGLRARGYFSAASVRRIMVHAFTASTAAVIAAPVMIEAPAAVHGRLRIPHPRPPRSAVAAHESILVS